MTAYGFDTDKNKCEVLPVSCIKRYTGVVGTGVGYTTTLKSGIDKSKVRVLGYTVGPYMATGDWVVNSSDVTVKITDGALMVVNNVSGYHSYDITVLDLSE